MADTKKPSLTVLGGPMAGTRFVFEEGHQDILVGSDEGASFRLQLPGVSPTHARIVIDAGGVAIYDTGSDRGLHVNDNRVDESGAMIRNGDIVWLGTPGDADVVMLQCILPRVTAAPASVSAEPAVVDETDTVALEPETLFGAAETVIQPPPEAPGAEPSIALEQDFVLAEEAPAAEPATFTFEEEATQIVTPAASAFEDETDEAAAEPPFVVVPDESSTVVIDAAEVTGTPEPTVAMYADEPAPEATMALPDELPEPTVHVPPPPPPKPSPPPKPEAPPPRTATAPRPAAPPGASAARPAAARPAARPRSAAAPPARAAASSGSSAGLYAGLGVAALLVLGGGGWAVWRFILNKPATPVAQVTPAPATQAPVATLPPATEPPAPVVEATPETPDETPPPVVEATPTPAATPTPQATPSPTPSPAQKKGAPPPTPAASPTPSADAQRAAQTAAQVSGLMAQAQAALGARQYDQGIAHLDEVLRLDPQNAKAASDRAAAVAQRDAARKRFVAGRTAVRTEKAQDSLAGFDSVAVQKAPDFLGRIEFEMTPASGVRPGDPYTLRFFLVNEGKKSIKLQGVTVNTVVNGSGSGAPVAAAVREVAPQQRTQIGEVSGSWKDGTSSWSTEVLITANKGDSLRNTITWR